MASDLPTGAPGDGIASETVGPALVATIRGTRAGLLVFAGIGAVNVGNAIFHLLAARLLGPSQYAEVVSLVAASGLISLPFGGVQFAVARFVADEASRENAGAVAAFVRRAMKGAVGLAVVVTVIVSALSPVVRNALGIHHLTPAVLMALYTLPALLAPAMWGVAQGLQRFGLISASMAVGTLVRIGVVVALIPLGIGVGGVMAATLISGFAALLVVLPLVWGWLERDPGQATAPPDRAVVGYVVPVVAGTLAITALTTVDLIVAKIALSSHDAGIYGSASFIGRLLLYLPTTVATVLLPKVTSRAAAEQDTKEILYASLAVTAAFSLFGTALLVVLPHLVIDATFGSKYGGAAPLLGLFGLAMTAYALLNVHLSYHLGHGRPRMAWLLLGGAVAQIVIYAFVHGSTYQIVGASLASALLMLVVHEVVFASTLWPTLRWVTAFLRQRAGRGPAPIV